jgi:hypothetical protein
VRPLKCRESGFVQSQIDSGNNHPALSLQLPFMELSESMGNHDSKIVGAGCVD